MKVVWKRPDGFLESVPNDFKVLEMPSKSRLWLHKRDQENFPFRISGGWQDEQSTKKLNSLVNLLAQSDRDWEIWLDKDFSDSELESEDLYRNSLREWLGSVKENLKGDTWELEIMVEAIEEIDRHISQSDLT